MIKNKDCNSTILVANLRRSGTKGNELVWSGAESTFAHTVAIKNNHLAGFTLDCLYSSHEIGLLAE